MPSNPKEEFHWVSIDRGSLKNKLIELAKERIVSLSFEDDVHPLGPKYSSYSSQGVKKVTPRSQNTALKCTAVKNVHNTNKSTFIDPLLAMSLKSEEDDMMPVDDDMDTMDETIGLLDLHVSENRPLTDDKWKALEESVLHSGENFDGKIQLPSTFHDIIAKLDSSEESSLSTVQARLDYLDALESGNKRRTSNFLGTTETTGLLDRNEFVSFVELLNNQLAKYWKDDQRVAVVKLVIQIVKILATPDDHMVTFYPSLFFLLSDLVTYFGYLVYDRLITKSPDLKVNFSFFDVGDQAKELCKNWMYKVASIRELVPRFYMETALLKCHKFSCEPEGFSSLVERLSLMVRGIANPVVAVYARMYLIHTVQQVMGSNLKLVQNIARQNYEELITIIKYKDSSTTNQNEGHKSKTSYDTFAPAIKWITHAQITRIDLDNPKRDEIIKRCFNELDSLEDPDPIIIHLLECASPQFIAADMNHLSRVVVSSAKTKISEANDDRKFDTASFLLASFGNALIRSSEQFKAMSAATNNKQNLLSVLNQAWKTIMSITDINCYLRCGKEYVSFATLHFGFKELDVIIGDILSHLVVPNSIPNHLADTSNTEEKDPIHNQLPVGNYWESTQSLKQIINTGIFGHDKEIWNPLEALSNCSNLMPLLEHLNSRDRLTVAKETLEKICDTPTTHRTRRQKENEDASSEKTYADPLSVNALTYLCSILSNSVDALTIEDERRQISGTICYVIRRIDFGDDFENQLKVYTECRGLFKNLDSVQTCLSHVVLNLATKVLRKSEQKQAHQKPKIHGFLQACCAFTYITIPSIRCIRTQLKMYILTAQVAFLCHCYGQGDASVQAAIYLCHQLDPKNVSITDNATRAILKEDIPNLISYLLVVPGYAGVEQLNMCEGNLQLIQSLLDVLHNSAIKDYHSLEICNVYIQSLQLLSVATWNIYPIHIGGVDSNDILMHTNDGGNIFIDGVNSLMEMVTSRLQDLILTALSNSPQKQTFLAWKLFHCILTNCNLDASSRGLTNLAYKLWLLTYNKGVYQKDIIHFIKEISLENKSGNLHRLITKIEGMS